MTAFRSPARENGAEEGERYAAERELSEMSQIAFGRTQSRSLLGSLNDFSLMARMRFVTSRNDPLERIARDLAETPLILPFDGAQPRARVGP